MSGILDFSHTITLYDAFGNRLQNLSEYEQLEYTLRENEVGELELSLPNIYDNSLFDVDRIIEVERTVGGRTYVDGETYWYIRKPRFADDRFGNERIFLTAKSAMSLLDRPIVAYVAGSSQADKSDYADDMMKEAVDENLGSAATDTDRDISAYLSIQGASSAAPTIEKAFSNRRLLPTLQEMANDSLKGGTYLAFDCVRLSPGKAEFRTYPGQRGVDHGSTSADPRIVSKERGNLVSPSIEFDYEDMENYVYAGGRGDGSDRIIKTAFDQNSINKSPVNRIEYFQDARNAQNPNTVQAEANYILQERRARIKFTGQIVDTETFRYGIDYNFGDIVVAEYQGYSIDCHIDTVPVSVRKGGESITAKLRGEILL